MRRTEDDEVSQIESNEKKQNRTRIDPRRRKKKNVVWISLDMLEYTSETHRWRYTMIGFSQDQDTDRRISACPSTKQRRIEAVPTVNRRGVSLLVLPKVNHLECCSLLLQRMSAQLCFTDKKNSLNREDTGWCRSVVVSSKDQYDGLDSVRQDTFQDAVSWASRQKRCQ